MARCLLSLMVCLSLAGGALGYQKSDKKGKATKGADSAYEIGQEVEVEYFSKWRPGKVVGLPASGRIQVEFEFDPLGDASGKAGGAKAKEGEEKKMKSFFDAKQVRVAQGGGGEKPKPAKSGGSKSAGGGRLPKASCSNGPTARASSRSRRGSRS